MRFVCPSVILFVVTLCLDAAPFKVVIIKKNIGKLPATSEYKGEKSRELLLLKLIECGKTIKDPRISSIWLFDPSQPKKGLSKVLIGDDSPKNILIEPPLFNGWSVAQGQLSDKDKLEPTAKFWFHLFDSKLGPEFDKGIIMKKQIGGWIIGQHVRLNPQKDGWLNQIVRYNPTTGVQQIAKLDFIYLKWVNNSSIIGVAQLEKGLGVVNYNPQKNTFELITTSSPKVAKHNIKKDAYFGVELFPAGENCRDGIYAVYAHDLWFLPKGKGQAWRRVIADLYVIGAKNGIIALPVCYVGNNRFAVTKTTQEPEAPHPLKKNNAVAMTLLMDGLTGRRINRSKLFIYDHLPPLKIPSEWWAKGMKPPLIPHVNNLGKSNFEVDRERRTIHFAKNKVTNYSAFNTIHDYGSRRYLLLTRCYSKVDKHPKSKCIIRVLDSKSGAIHNTFIESDFDRINIIPYWLESK